MAIFKCKMCGSDLNVTDGMTVAECEYCETKQTLPRLDDERRSNLYDRANHFRRNNEFDKAMGIYEQILNEDTTDAEAYWSLVLCRYGIEYVEDPASKRRIPTVNRAQFTSIFDDEDYKSALQYADTFQKEIYEHEAKAINEIQKGILAISQKEEPFDVFICYKETDNNGRRTPDSVLATELYHELTRDGFKVFFSRITLEDKLGQEYEPYIFAALNSAKVMVVLGTKPEHFNAVWVKNEWSRYLSLIKNGARKMLIPAYKDMNLYDLPEEFSHLQAQDMSRLGFMQDLVRGIKKITETVSPKVAAFKETLLTTDSHGNTTALLKRGFMSLEDGEWAKADEFFEQCLNQNAELAEAYLGKLMAELRVKTRDELKDCDNPFDNSNNYQKTVRFANEKLKNTLSGYVEYINERNEQNRLESIYTSAVDNMNVVASDTRLLEFLNIAAQKFESISGYKDADALAEECRQKADALHKNITLAEAKAKMINYDIGNYKNLISVFESLNGWKDSNEQIKICKQRIENIKEYSEIKRIEGEKQEEINRINAKKASKRRKVIGISVISAIWFIIAVAILYTSVIVPFKERRLGKMRIAENESALASCKVGDYIKWGAYEQDNDESNGRENIEWLVLDIKDGKALVVSRYALDCKPYDKVGGDVSWEDCTLNAWLNDDFIDEAFSKDEQEAIIDEDVFLLSIDEVNKYFDSDEARECEATVYAEANGADTDGSACYWWLRSNGDNSNTATYVRKIGLINEKGVKPTNTNLAVRPAMWITLNP